MSINQVFQIKKNSDLNQFWYLINKQLRSGFLDWFLERADADYEVKVSITKIKKGD